jgi:hypothetical protein
MMQMVSIFHECMMALHIVNKAANRASHEHLHARVHVNGHNCLLQLIFHVINSMATITTKGSTKQTRNKESA